MKYLAKLASRKLWLAVFGLYVIISQDVFGVAIPQEAVDSLVKFLEVVILTFGGVDLVNAWKQK